jgi:prephenate dehydrogenase/chorismate mutase
VADKNLKELRQEIREVDSELVNLLARRLRVVCKIGNLKQELKMPIVDAATEKAVIENYVKSASKAGIDRGLAKRIAELIIEASVELQTSMRPLRSAEPAAANVTVIGAGGMGSWFARFFKSRGSHVTVSDRNQRKARLLASRVKVAYASNNIEAVRGSDVVVIATPAKVVPNVVDEILPALKESALLIDISAVKSSVMPVLRSAGKRGVQVASIHPLFGPLASGLREKNVILVKTGRNAQGSRKVGRMLEGARLLSTDPKDHDRVTALTLALPHFLNMAFAMTISSHGNLAKIRKFAGRTFSLQMLLAEAVANEPEVTTDIQVMNKEFRAILRDLQLNVRLLAETVNKEDRTNLLARYKQIRKRLSADPEFALAGEAFERVSQAASTYSKT